MGVYMDIRPMTLGDSHHLINIDSKASEFAWDVEDWQILQKYFPDWKVWIVSLMDTPKAFAVVEVDHNEDISRIHKMAALPEARRIGADLSLLDTIEYDAVVSGVGTVEFVVSETSCRGGNDPYDISAWLLRRGFKCEETGRETYDAYGKMYDGFAFRKLVHKEKEKK